MISTGFTVGQLTCFLSYANQYTKPFNEISNVITELQNAMACAGRVFELLDETPQVPEKEQAHVLTDTKGAIEIKGVNFSYVKDKTLITNPNLCKAGYACGNRWTDRMRKEYTYQSADAVLRCGYRIYFG